MSLYDVTSETDRMRSERATVRTLGVRLDEGVRNPNVGGTAPNWSRTPPLTRDSGQGRRPPRPRISPMR